MPNHVTRKIRSTTYQALPCLGQPKKIALHRHLRARHTRTLTGLRSCSLPLTAKNVSLLRAYIRRKTESALTPIQHTKKVFRSSLHQPFMPLTWGTQIWTKYLLFWKLKLFLNKPCSKFMSKANWLRHSACRMRAGFPRLHKITWVSIF